MDEQSLLQQHIDVLFQKNEAGDLTVLNEAPYDTAPQFYVGVTRKKSIAKYQERIAPTLRKQLEAIVSETPNDQLLQAIQLFSAEQKLKQFHLGPFYEIPTIASQIEGPIEITEDNKYLIKEAFPYTHDELAERAPVFTVIEAGVPVSLCCSARQTSEAAEASVFTNEHYRGRGYAVDVVRAWAKKVQQQNRTAFYSTSWDNFSSRMIAEKLAMKRIGFDITLD